MCRGPPRSKRIDTPCPYTTLVRSADEDAMIGLGLKKSTSRAALRQAAMDGSIMDLVDWWSAAAGDFYYSPAGTVHALGPGLVLVEVQQNRSEEHTSEPQSLMRNSNAVFCLKKKKKRQSTTTH